MNTRPVSLRIPEEVRSAIQDIAQRTQRDFSSIANEMLSEAVKMRRFFGIEFVDSPCGRVARIAGSGAKVYLVVRAYRDVGEDFARLQRWYAHLPEWELRAGLAYAEAFPEEVERRIALDEEITPEWLDANPPFVWPARQIGQVAERG
ncbi:MAG: hypothetical protein HW416_25 [Chloroflexi bacterium]|nr:hypothetical protein [Chloroflexota bacterium]